MDAQADLTKFQTDCLIAIARMDEPHGLGLKDELQDAGYGEVHHGRLYPNLDTLVDKGLVSKASRDKRTNVYTLTDRGRRELDEYLEWANSAPVGAQPP